MTLDVRLPSGRTALLSGRVVADDASPLADVNVSLRSAEPRLHLLHGGARADREGRFLLQDVAPGRYQLVAEEVVPVAGPRGRRQPGRTGWSEV
ncbi:MAG: carboxypeptidase regulatory-like domain-containing protein, partial [Acidobacteria bacterium]|nr:carboxypeptidase regulatory-like domain-containing protein [Acidobacteriota bacterium]